MAGSDGLCLQFPVMIHGNDTVADSACIMTYLFNTYPEQLSFLKPKDTQRCATDQRPPCNRPSSPGETELPERVVGMR